MSQPASTTPPQLLDSEASRRHLNWRLWKDAFMRHAVGFGGISVIIIITLIFFYLLWVVMPMFRGAELQPVADYGSPAADQGRTLRLAMEEQAEVGLRVTERGELVFFSTHDGKLINTHHLPLKPGQTITGFARGQADRAILAFGLSDGTAIVVHHKYEVSYPPEGGRVITPVVEYPLGEAPVDVDPFGKPVTVLAVQSGEERLSLAAPLQDQRLILVTYMKEESFLGEEMSFTRSEEFLDGPPRPTRFLRIDQDQQELYAVTEDNVLFYYDINDPESASLLQQLPLVGRDEAGVTAFESLMGGISLLVGHGDGRLVQWSAVPRDGGPPVMTRIREFDPLPAAIAAIRPEHHRKGFAATDVEGNLGIYHTTAHRTLLQEAVLSGAIRHVAFGPRANALLVEDEAGQMRFIGVDNQHPEISWSALWGKVWYESYPEPSYQWQSSAATSDFEPKLSLVPISFGTLKAAFYAMLLAIPLAIMGAIFTSQFMAPRMRRVVKPSIEIMEALPTVILGFLAGLWLAPFVEKYLPTVFALAVVMPFGVILAAWVWHRLPDGVRHRVPDGWEGALLIPVIALLVWLGMLLNPVIETTFFGGDMRLWLTNEMGIPFDQRNSIVVGLAMGFAVIPTIFSIAEDALFAVPKHLINGSLALGATPWQTMMRVVLLTASPGIFSAIMIGFGRAVGETMIVLMATGNTPVMDFSIFQGMRTLSANIAVEMPEAEVASTHYRVLFLAALVLFAFTFLFNTAGEVVRQRLRRRYSSL